MCSMIRIGHCSVKGWNGWSKMVRSTLSNLVDDAGLNARVALPPLIDARKEPELEKMYQLFSGVDGTKVLLEGFKLYIQVYTSYLFVSPT